MLLSPPSNIGSQCFFGSLPAFSQIWISVLVPSSVPEKFADRIFLAHNSSWRFRQDFHDTGHIRVDEGNTDVPSFPPCSDWPIPVRVSLKRLKETRFQLAVPNSLVKTVTDIQIEFIKQNGSVGYMLSGITRKRSKVLKPTGHLRFVSCSFTLPRSYPVLKVTSAGREYLSDLSIFPHHYHLLRDTTPD